MAKRKGNSDMGRFFGGSRISEKTVRQALATIQLPDSGQNIVDSGLLQGLVIKDGRVVATLAVDAARAEALEPLRAAAAKAIEAVRGVASATVVLTASSRPQPAPKERQNPTPEPTAGGQGIPGVGAIIAVASGKGGVGKSTVAVNLALGLKAAGRRVGLLDADVYGPSVPRMLGINERPRSADGKTMQPLTAHGLKCMSMGFLVAEDTATIWRGPMVAGALQQMIGDVDWGPLDVLVIDMPPGTGDAQLTIAQRLPLLGAVIVSTPQDIALIDARKGLAMFERVDVPVFGFVENMSYFACPHCGQRSEIFGHGGARQWAEKLGAGFLGEIPLHIAIRETSDAGQPIVASAPDSAEAEAFLAVARRVDEKITEGLARQQRTTPKIVIE